MPLIDFYEVRDFQVQGAQNILNVYQYRNLGTGGPASNIAQAFIDTVFPAVRPIQVAGLFRTFLEVENLGSPFDFATVDTSSFPGTRPGIALSTLIGASIQLNRTRMDIKNGQKRFAAGTETDSTGNFWDAPFLAELQALADVLVQPLQLAGSPGIDRAELVILKRFCTVLPSPPCTGVYRLPDTDLEADNNNYSPVTATARATVRSQVSRKRLV